MNEQLQNNWSLLEKARAKKLSDGTWQRSNIPGWYKGIRKDAIRTDGNDDDDYETQLAHYYGPLLEAARKQDANISAEDLYNWENDLLDENDFDLLED